MTKASAKKIKDPLAKARGKCEYDHETALTLSSAYWMSAIHDEFYYGKFAKVCELSGLSNDKIALGDPERQTKIIEEIHERFVEHMLLLAHEDKIRWVWDGLLDTGYLKNPGFLYLVLQNDLDTSETFFPYILGLRAALNQKALQDFATVPCPSNNAVNHSFAPLAPWGYAPTVDCVHCGSVCNIWKGDPFYRLVATGPFFRSTVELGVATLRKLEERGVSEYFIPDAAYLPAFLATGLDLSDKYFYRPERLNREDAIFRLYGDAATKSFPCGAVQSRFKEKLGLELAIANRLIGFHEGQVLFYEFPFALPEYSLAEAVCNRLWLLQSGAIFTFTIRQDCPSNRLWLEILGRDDFPNLLFSGTSANSRGELTTSDDVVKRAIAMAPYSYNLETIESHDEAGGLVATQYVITRE